MPLRIKCLGYIVGDRIVLTGDRTDISDFVAVLTNLESCADGIGPTWIVELVIGEGASRRNVDIQLVPFLSQMDYELSFQQPKLLNVPNGKIYGVLFKNRFFASDRDPKGAAETEELLLRVKRAVYKDEEELKSLRSYVSNIEAALEYQRTGPQRESVPDDVKLAVWARDGGACVRCGANEKLHFDHIIPVAKGGANTLSNIQILCEPCNLKKSDNIAF